MHGANGHKERNMEKIDEIIEMLKEITTTDPKSSNAWLYQAIKNVESAKQHWS